MTKTHVIGGVTYKEVVRKAEVGEKIVIYGVEGAIYAIAGVVTKNGEHVNGFAPEVYRVLEPIDTPPTDDLLEITANLTHRVFDLERENKRLRDDVTETLGTITDLLRRRDRRIEEIERKVFDTSSLKPFDLATLNGKRVTLLHGEDGGYEILAAKDEDGNFYVISEKEACK